MKNLMIYINPRWAFEGEYSQLVRVQIDNSLTLGWEPGDIMLVTNFPYEYSRVRAMRADDDNFCTFDRRMSKINVIVDLFRRGLVEDGRIYWYHDFDAFQVGPITKDVLGLGMCDLGVTDLGWSRKLNTGSMFFGIGAADIFGSMREIIYEKKVLEETALEMMMEGGLAPGRYKVLDVAYNINMHRVESNLRKAEKPIKVLHFHPTKRGGYLMSKFSAAMNPGLRQAFAEAGISCIG
jgi:hypothetical protein